MVNSMTNEMQFGVATGIFGHRDALTAGKIRQFEAAKIDWIEIGALQEQHISVFDDEHVEEIVEAVQRSRLGVWSFHAPFCGFAMDDADTRERGIRRLIRAGEVAAKIEARYVVVHPGRDVAIVDRERQLGWCREGLERALEGIPVEVGLALETMGRNGLACPPDELLRVIEGLDENRVGICLDSGHVNLGYDVVEYVKKVGHRIVSLHLHDNHGEQDEHAMVGDGTIDWPVLIKTLHQAGYAGVWMFEGSSQVLGPVEATNQFVERMQEFAGS